MQARDQVMRGRHVRATPAIARRRSAVHAVEGVPRVLTTVERVREDFMSDKHLEKINDDLIEENERLTRENRSMNETISRLSIDLARHSPDETPGGLAPYRALAEKFIEANDLEEPRRGATRFFADWLDHRRAVETTETPPVRDWRGLLDPPRVRVVGSAGLFNDPDSKYGFLTIEMWTEHEARTTPATQELLEKFFVKASLSVGQHVPEPDRLGCLSSQERHALYNALTFFEQCRNDVACTSNPDPTMRKLLQELYDRSSPKQ